VRILQVHTTYREPGGEDIVVRAEAELLRGAGHEVVEYQAANPFDAVGAAMSLASSPWNAAAARSVRRFAEEVRPHVAHVHNTWYALSPAVLRALRTTGSPVVMTLHNYRLLCVNALLFRDGRPCEDCVGTHPWHGVRHGCYRGSAVLSVPPAATIAVHRRMGTWRRDVDLFLALNAFSKALMVRGGLPPERIRVKPNFVDDPGPRAVPARDSPIVLYVGRLVGQKGVETLVEGWRLLGSTGLELVIVGDGPLRARLEKGAPPGVRFAGRLGGEDVRELMLAARTLVFPSLSYEAQPMVILEALAAGLPVLASNLGGTPELLEAVGEGWTVQAGDPLAWATGLRRLADQQNVDHASNKARALYERTFTNASATAALEAAYGWAQEAARKS
jgi:glycosyltransferase involved in cell wall biosynthesis